jgi:hypothetical protein
VLRDAAEAAAPPRAEAGASWSYREPAIFAVVFLIYFLCPLRISTDSALVLHRAYSLLHGEAGALDGLIMAVPQHHGATLAPNGTIQSMYPVGPSLLVLPAVAVLDQIAPDLRASLMNRATAKEIEVFLASLIGAISAVLMWRLALRATSRSGVAALATLIFAFASPMLSTASRGLWQHGPLVLVILGTWLAFGRAGDAGSSARRWLCVAGLLTAFSFVVRPLALPFVFAASIYALLLHRRDAIVFLSAGIAVAVSWVGFNVWAEGQIVPPYYLPGGFEIRGGGWQERVLGQIVSPSRGLLVYSPIFLLACVGPILKYRRGALDRNDGLAIGAAIALLLLHAGSVAWWAGWSYGPRYMTDVVPFVAYLCIDPLDRIAGLPRSATRSLCRAAVAILLLISVGMHANGAINQSTHRWNEEPAPIDDRSQFPRLWDWRRPQFLAGPFVLPPNNLRAAASGFWSPPPPKTARIAVFFDAAPLRPDFIRRLRASSGLRVAIPWTASAIERLGGTVHFDVVAWSNPAVSRALSIRVAGREYARWNLQPDGRRTVQSITIPVEQLTAAELDAPLEIVADDAPGLLKVAIGRVWRP